MFEKPAVKAIVLAQGKNISSLNKSMETFRLVLQDGCKKIITMLLEECPWLLPWVRGDEVDIGTEHPNMTAIDGEDLKINFRLIITSYTRLLFEDFWIINVRLY